MSVMPKKSWVVLGQIAAVFAVVICTSVYFFENLTLKDSVLMWSWSVIGAFTSIELQHLSSKE